MITALKKIYAFSGRWKGVLKKSVVFSLLHSIFDMFQIGALFLILNGLVEGITGQDIPVSYTHLDVYKRQDLYWANWSQRLRQNHFNQIHHGDEWR